MSADAMQFEQRLADRRARHRAGARFAGAHQFAGRGVLRALLQHGGWTALDQLAAREDGSLEPHGERQAKVASEDQQGHATVAIGGEQCGQQSVLRSGTEHPARLVADEKIDAALEAAGEFPRIVIGADDAGAFAGEPVTLNGGACGQQAGDGLGEQRLATVGATDDGKGAAVGQRQIELGDGMAAGDGDAEAGEFKRHGALP